MKDSKAFISYLNQYNYNIKMIREYIKKSEELLMKIEEYIATLPDGKEKDELLSEIKGPAEITMLGKEKYFSSETGKGIK